MRLPRIYLVVCAVAAFAWGAIFLGSGWLAGLREGIDWASRLDAAIPYCPWAVWPYLAVYLYPPAALLLLRDARQANRTILAVLLATGLAAVIYVGLPIRFAYPEVPDSVHGRLLAWTIHMDFDPPANKFPSLHVALPFIFCAAFHRQAVPRWMLAGAWCLFLVVSLSTLLVKQHIWLDVLGGLGLGGAVWWISGVLMARVPARPDAPVTELGSVLAGGAVVFLCIAGICVGVFALLTALTAWM